ncbi:serine/threonine-protein kinase PITSLRE isoform X2 [Eurosta solidaginis]
MRNDRGGGGGGGGGGVARPADMERNHRADHRKGGEERSEDIARYHQRGNAYERGNDDGANNRNMMHTNERRYVKHYDTHNNDMRRNAGGGGYHQQYQHPHMQRQRHDYYERGTGGGGGGGGYHHHGGIDYYNNRHQHHHQQQQHQHQQHQQQQQQQPQQQYAGGGGKHSHMEYKEIGYEMQRERRKYNYDAPNDSESIEQDLRSRLLSKRHKYVKGKGGDIVELAESYEATEIVQKKSRYTTDGERISKRTERHRQKREKARQSVIVIDSPEHGLGDGVVEDAEARRQRRKHKRRNKEREALQLETATAPVVQTTERVDKRKTPDDPEALSRRDKMLASERDKDKRKEMAREELEARRRDRNALSPSTVAASVTAGLNIMKRKKHIDASEGIKSKRSKKTKSSKHQRSIEDEEEGEAIDSDYEDDEQDEDESESPELETDSGDSGDSESDSVSQSEAEEVQERRKKHRHHRKRSKVERKKRKKKHRSRKARNANTTDNDDDAEDDDADENDDDHNDNDVDDDDAEDQELPDSPLSVGILYKSPKRLHRARKHKKKKNKKHHDIEEEGEELRSSRSRSASHSISRSRSHTPRQSRSPQRTHSPLRSGSSRLNSRSRSRSGSHSQFESISMSSRSGSDSSDSDSRSRSRTRTRSRSRSEERHMKSAHKSEAEATAAGNKRHLGSSNRGGSPVRDEKGAPLPDYFPGIQGCRSVEEFQCLNRIEEGTYGVVYRAKDKRTSEIVALKRLKMEKEKEGFPITSLREINTLLKGQHPNIVTVREIVVGSNMDKIFIVMDYVEHDLKSLMETMKARKQFFLPGEVKCLVQQLLRAVGHLHDNWILHRDLKTSNLLLSHKGILKVGDFGLAREYGSPLKKYTSLVVTLWYRAPELLLCSPEYSTPIDIWSVGCIFGEFMQMGPLFPGKTETDELNKIFKELGTPNERIWPGYKELPAVRNMLSQNSQFADYPVSNIRKRFAEKTTDIGIELLQGLLTYDPKKRLTADTALKHSYFSEIPLPIDPSMFPTWPAKSELGARKALTSSPKPPSGGSQFKQLGRDEIIVSNSTGAAGTGGGSNNAPSAASNSKVISGIITGNKKSTTNTGFVLSAGVEQRQLAMGPGFNLKF